MCEFFLLSKMGSTADEKVRLERNGNIDKTIVSGRIDSCNDDCTRRGREIIGLGGQAYESPKRLLGGAGGIPAAHCNRKKKTLSLPSKSLDCRTAEGGGESEGTVWDKKGRV